MEVDLPQVRRTEVSSRTDLFLCYARPPLVAAAATIADTSIGPSSGPVSIPPAPTKSAALLSRIGDVKKRGVMRKSEDSTPILPLRPI